VRRSRVERQDDDHRAHHRDGVERGRQAGRGYGNLISGVLDCNAVEPHDPTFAMRNLSAVVIVRFEMSMRNCARMVRIRLVDVFRRDDSRNREPRDEDESGDRSPRRRHVGTDYGHSSGMRQT